MSTPDQRGSREDVFDGDDDLFDLPELDDVARAAHDLNLELGGGTPIADSAEEFEDDELVKLFPAEMLEGDSAEDLFAFESLLADDESPELDAHILAEDTVHPESAAEVQARADEALPVPAPAAAEVADDFELAPEPPPVDLPPRTARETAPRSGGSLFDRVALVRAGHASPQVWWITAAMFLLNALVMILGLVAVYEIGAGMRNMGTSLAGSLRELSQERATTPIVAPITAPPVEAPAEKALVDESPAPEPEAPRLVAPIGLEPRERTELRAASEEIAAGKFEMARRRLFRLLAVADSPLSEEGRIAEHEANWLIAESFAAQARAGEVEQPTRGTVR